MTPAELATLRAGIAAQCTAQMRASKDSAAIAAFLDAPTIDSSQFVPAWSAVKYLVKADKWRGILDASTGALAGIGLLATTIAARISARNTVALANTPGMMIDLCDASATAMLAALKGDSLVNDADIAGLRALSLVKISWAQQTFGRQVAELDVRQACYSDLGQWMV